MTGTPTYLPVWVWRELGARPSRALSERDARRSIAGAVNNTGISDRVRISTGPGLLITPD